MELGDGLRDGSADGTIGIVVPPGGRDSVGIDELVVPAVDIMLDLGGVVVVARRDDLPIAIGGPPDVVASGDLDETTGVIVGVGCGFVSAVCGDDSTCCVLVAI